jgi:pimeloyl-ACP methyl ester carboxylesterase
MHDVTSSMARVIRGWLAALLLLSGSTACVAAAAGALVLEPCTIDGLARPARCGVLEVAENPRRPLGRTLPIHMMVIPASNGTARPDPIVLLMGGPGEDAITAAPVFARLLAPLLEDRDLLLVDQRGTGRSNALRCELYSPKDPAVSLRHLFPLEAVQECAQQLGARADLTQYGYARFAADLEQIRRALGYGTLNLSAGSYGTRAAQVYLRTYPRSVRTVYLGSVVPFDVAIPLPNARVTEVALQRVFDACAAESPCRTAFPELSAEFRALVARLANARGLDSALSVGLLFSITCSEDLAFVRDTEVRRDTQGTALGDYRVRQQLEACRQWPKYVLERGYRQPVRSSVPALFVSGDTDAATPLWYTKRVAAGFPNRHEVIQAGLGHTEWNECTQLLYQRFVTTGGVRGVAKSVCAAPTALPFKTQ